MPTNSPGTVKNKVGTNPANMSWTEKTDQRQRYNDQSDQDHQDLGPAQPSVRSMPSKQRPAACNPSIDEGNSTVFFLILFLLFSTTSCGLIQPPRVYSNSPIRLSTDRPARQPRQAPGPPQKSKRASDSPLCLKQQENLTKRTSKQPLANL